MSDEVTCTHSVTAQSDQQPVHVNMHICTGSAELCEFKTKTYLNTLASSKNDFSFGLGGEFKSDAGADATHIVFGTRSSLDLLTWSSASNYTKADFELFAKQIFEAIPVASR